MGWKVLLPARSSGGQHSPTRLPKLLGASPPPPSILAPKYPSPQTHTLVQPEKGAS